MIRRLKDRAERALIWVLSIGGGHAFGERLERRPVDRQRPGG